VSGNKKVWIERNGFLQVLGGDARWTPKETGGILMGFKNSGGIFITNVFGPGPKAVHEHFSYTPDYDHDEKVIAETFIGSGGKITYLGDWHTHPLNPSYMSGRDKETLKRISQYKPARLLEPVMLILGTQPLSLRGWLYKRSLTNSIIEVEVNLVANGESSWV
jgi:integrative and conjugative element protein (TIGR02256 family)